MLPTVLGDTARAASSSVHGPFEKTYTAETINISAIADRPVNHETAEDLPSSAEDGMDKAKLPHVSGSAVSASGGQQPPSSGDLLTIGAEYDGVRDLFQIEPPLQDPPLVPPSDSQVAVGRSKSLHAVNRKIAIFNQSSGVIELEVPFDRFFDPLITETVFATGTPIVADPRTRYDPGADRFVVSVFYMHFVSWSGFWLVAVSDDSNPNGSWHLYRIPTHSGDWPDYARLGIGRDAMYLTASTIPQTGVFPADYDEELAILDKHAMYNGGETAARHFTGLLQGGPASFVDYVVQPAFQPRSGGDAGKYYLLNTQGTQGPPADTLTLWEVTNPLDEPSLEYAEIDVEPFWFAPPARQPDTDASLEIDSFRLMNLHYTDGSLWTAHAVGHDWDDGDRPVAVIRWYEIDPVTTSVVQSGTVGEPGRSYFHPHIRSDGDRTLIVHDLSGPNTYPGIKVAGRTADCSDGEIEDTLWVQEGQSAMDHPERFGRRDPVWWQDYTGMSIHPKTGNFWVTAQYSPEFDSDGTEPDRYQTRIAEVSVEEGGDNRRRDRVQSSP